MNYSKTSCLCLILAGLVILAQPVRVEAQSIQMSKSFKKIGWGTSETVQGPLVPFWIKFVELDGRLAICGAIDHGGINLKNKRQRRFFRAGNIRYDGKVILRNLAKFPNISLRSRASKYMPQTSYGGEGWAIRLATDRIIAARKELSVNPTIWHLTVPCRKTKVRFSKGYNEERATLYLPSSLEVPY